MLECGKVLCLREPVEDIAIVARMRCHRKTCSECWPLYAKNVCSRVRGAKWAGGQAGSFASSFILYSKTPGLVDRYKERLRARAEGWVAIPLPKGWTALITSVWVEGSTPVRDLNVLVWKLLKHHDRSRHITSSHQVRAAQRPTSTWSLMAPMGMGLEAAIERLEQSGLRGEWTSVNCYLLKGVPEVKLLECLGRPA